MGNQSLLPSPSASCLPCPKDEATTQALEKLGITFTLPIRADGQMCAYPRNTMVEAKLSDELGYLLDRDRGDIQTGYIVSIKTGTPLACISWVGKGYDDSCDIYLLSERERQARSVNMTRVTRTADGNLQPTPIQDTLFDYITLANAYHEAHFRGQQQADLDRLYTRVQAIKAEHKDDTAYPTVHRLVAQGDGPHGSSESTVGALMALNTKFSKPFPEPPQPGLWLTAK